MLAKLTYLYGSGVFALFFLFLLFVIGIHLLPSKYLMHKKRSKISPNTIQRSAFALSYYLNFLDEKQLCLDDIYQMKYIEQHEHFTDFLIWLKAGMHSREDYLKTS